MYKGMTEGINISGFSCITTAAVTGFYSLFCTSRCSGLCPFAKAMTEGIYFSGFSYITATAVTGFYSLFCTSWCGSYCPFAKAMTECILIICNITIAAGACICGVALCGAGGFGYD